MTFAHPVNAKPYDRLPTITTGRARSRAAGLLLFAGLLPGFVSAGYFPMYHSWPQPDGPGSPLTLTYSFSNLFDGAIRDSLSKAPIPNTTLHDAFTVAFQDYADFLPIHFVEIADNNGPLPETGEYDPTGLADIRIGQVTHVDGANAYAYFPFAVDSGLAGDIVFNAERFGSDWTTTLFYAVAQHEIGHSLGMGHFVNDSDGHSDAHVQHDRYAGPRFPLDRLAVQALQEVYGEGIGSVTPLSAVPLPASALLLGSACVALLGFSCRRSQADGDSHG